MDYSTLKGTLIKVTWLLLLLLLAILCKHSFTAASPDICISCLEFYILYSPLHKENDRFAFEDNKNSCLALDNFDTCIFPGV